jgi:amino acid permease
LAIIFLVCIAGPVKHVMDHIPTPSYNIFSISGTLASTGSIVFCLACSAANFQAYVTTEEDYQDLYSWSWITGISLLIASMLTVLVGFIGYLSFGDKTSGNILDNFPQHGYDIFQLSNVLHLILYIPVGFIIMRYSFVKIFSGMKSEDLHFPAHVSISTGLLVFSAVIVLVLLAVGEGSGTAFSLILNITGGIGGKFDDIFLMKICLYYYSILGSLSTLIMPGAIYLKVMPPESPWHNYARALFVFGIIVMVIVVVFTILSVQ